MCFVEHNSMYILFSYFLQHSRGLTIVKNRLTHTRPHAASRWSSAREALLHKTLTASPSARAKALSCDRERYLLPSAFNARKTVLLLSIFRLVFLFLPFGSFPFPLAGPFQQLDDFTLGRGTVHSRGERARHLSVTGTLLHPPGPKQNAQILPLIINLARSIAHHFPEK